MQGERILFGGGVIDYVRRSSDRYNVLQEGFGIVSGSSQPPQFNWQSALLSAVPSGWFYFEKLNYNRAFQDYLLPAIDIPARRVSLDACRRTDAYFKSLATTPRLALVLRHQIFSAFMLPALSRAVQKTALMQTGVDCAAVACALERYHLAQGYFPDSLGSLVPDFIAQVPHDIIDGHPLRYHRTPDGRYVLYSVGWNEADDGGVLGLKSDGQHLENTTGDWVWRLPDGA